jgi:hypothetical protein
MRFPKRVRTRLQRPVLLYFFLIFFRFGLLKLLHFGLRRTNGYMIPSSAATSPTIGHRRRNVPCPCRCPLESSIPLPPSRQRTIWPFLGRAGKALQARSVLGGRCNLHCSPSTDRLAPQSSTPARIGARAGNALSSARFTFDPSAKFKDCCVF